MLSVAGINVNQIFLLLEYPVTHLPGTVIVHTAKQDDPLGLGDITVVSCFEIRRGKLQEFFIRLDEIRDILTLDSKGCGVPFCLHLCFVPSNILFNKVLADQVLLFHNIAIAYDDPNSSPRGVAQPVQVRYDISAGTARADHNDLDRSCTGILHTLAPNRKKRRRPENFSLAGVMLLSSSGSGRSICSSQMDGWGKFVALVSKTSIGSTGMK